MAKAKVKRLVQDSALRIVQIDTVQFDPSYQRGVVGKHKRIVGAFNPQALGIPVFGERDDGTIWCVDGRQRLTALTAIGRKRVRAEVFASRGPEHEAEVFRLINQNRTKLKPTELFHAALTAGDQQAWTVKNAADEFGFKIIKGGSHGVKDSPEVVSNRLTCVNTLLRGLRTGGEDALRFALETVRDLWPGDPLRTQSDIFSGLFAFYSRRDGVVDKARLIPRLATTTPSKLMYSASLGVGDRGANIADVIERQYRKRYVNR